jgi:hypothetical protein
MILLSVYRVCGGISVASGCYRQCDTQHSIEWWLVYTQVNPHIQKIAIHSGQFVHVERTAHPMRRFKPDLRNRRCAPGSAALAA